MSFNRCLATLKFKSGLMLTALEKLFRNPGITVHSSPMGSSLCTKRCFRAVFIVEPIRRIDIQKAGWQDILKATEWFQCLIIWMTSLNLGISRI
jgi:hypothetical protein